nr:endonuclease domain-containing protein [Dialister succinatiphilus]
MAFLHQGVPYEQSPFEPHLKSQSCLPAKRDDSGGKKLWYQYLRSYPVKFRRQQIQAPFILDFYCHQARLAIEIDGSQHYTDYGRSYDQWRTKHIEKKGIAVLRFSNSDIRHRFDGVRIMIDLIVKKRVEELGKH